MSYFRSKQDAVSVVVAKGVTRPAAGNRMGIADQRMSWPASLATISLATCLLSLAAWRLGLREPIPVMSDADRKAYEDGMADQQRRPPAMPSPISERGGQQTPFEPGTVLPPFAIERWVNGRVDLDALKGQVVVVDVWDDD